MEVIMNSKIYLIAFLFILIHASCELKSKVYLYLERDLDILNNVKVVNFQLAKDFEIEKIGVVRDLKNSSKTMILKMDSKTTQNCVDKYIVNIELIYNYMGDTKHVVKEIKPILLSVNSNKYITTEIHTNGIHKVEKVVYHLNNSRTNIKIKNSELTVNNLYTNND